MIVYFEGKRVNIAICINNLNAGGAERIAAELSKYILSGKGIVYSFLLV